MDGKEIWCVYDHDSDGFSDDDLIGYDSYETKDDAVKACDGWQWDELPEVA